MKVALVHDWLTGMRGGEKCLAELCSLYPEADLYTLVHERGSVDADIERRVAGTSFLQSWPRATRWYRYYLPFMPAAVEALDLFEYDLVLSSSHCVAKGVLTRPDATHLSYVYSPMRYAWDQWPQYFPRRGLLGRAVMPFALSRLRQWDVSSSARLRHIVSISDFVADRVRRTWGRESTVVHPPVDTESFDARREPEDWYLMVSALVPYKRVDLAIDACLQSGRKLKVVGGGPLEAQLRRRLREAGDGQIELMGRVSDGELRELYARCRALVHAAVEDFGLAYLEANSSGRPAIGLDRGGSRELIVPVNPDQRPRGADWSAYPPTGVWVREQSVDGMIRALDVFEEEERAGCFDPDALRAHAQNYGRERYRRRMAEEVERALDLDQQATRSAPRIPFGPAPLRRVSPELDPASVGVPPAAGSDDPADSPNSTPERTRHASTQG